MISKEIIFLNLDKALEICKICKREKLKSRRLWNKKQVLEKIAKGEIDIYLTSKKTNTESRICYNLYSCALAHYNKECMQTCLQSKNEVMKVVNDYKLWSYCGYQNS